MKLIIGLGNVGAHFDGTRHNIGFTLIELFAGLHNLDWHSKERFKASLAEGTVYGQKVVLVKPHTYYNLSGEAAQAVQSFYKIVNQDTLVIHDELDLPFGTLRTRTGGSDAGNNGIKSVTAHLGPDYVRLRVGIVNDIATQADAVDFVLGHFSHEENQQMPQLTREALALLDAFIDDNKKFEHTSVRTT